MGKHNLSHIKAMVVDVEHNVNGEWRVLPIKVKMGEGGEILGIRWITKEGAERYLGEEVWEMMWPRGEVVGVIAREEWGKMQDRKKRNKKEVSK